MTSYEFLKSRVLAQFENTESIDAILKAFAKQLDELDTMFTDLKSLRWIDTAQGKQLDNIGEIVVASRSVDGEQLNDDDFRLILNAKKVKNTWQGDIPGSIEVWNAAFKDQKLSLTDNQDMSMTALLVGKQITEAQRQLILSGMVVPRPGGVMMDYFNTEGDNVSAFGFNIENEFIKGFNESSWAKPL